MSEQDAQPSLESLFSQKTFAQKAPSLTVDALSQEEFVAQVMSKSRWLRYKNLAPWVCISVIVAAVIWYFAVPFELAQLIAQWLTLTLVDLGEGWLAWAFAPVNNIGALLVLSVKLFRMAGKRIFSPSYATY